MEKGGDGMACNYFGKNYIWVGVSQEKKKGPVLKSLVAKGDKIEFGYCYATTTSSCDNEQVSTSMRWE